MSPLLPNEYASIFPPVEREGRGGDWLRRPVALLIRGLLRTYGGLRIEGAENLPNEGSFVLVANHTSHLDALCLLAALPLARLPRAATVAAEDYFFQSRARFWIAALTVNALPFTRGKGARESLAACAEVLAQDGRILIIFPEGTRARDGKLQPFRGGIGALVAGRDLPVLPCHIEGAHRSWPKGGRWPRPARLRLRIGRPRHYAAPAGRAAIAEELHAAVEALGRKHGRD